MIESKTKHAAFDVLKCTECGAAIPVSQAIAAQVAEQTRQEMSEVEAQQQEQLATAERDFAARRAALERESEQRLETALSAERSRLEDAARSAVLLELEDFKRRVAEQQAVIVGARQAELALRAERRSLKEQLQTVELEVTRRVDDQRSQLEEAVGKRFADEYRLRIAEKDKALEDARHAYDELSRKLQQSSQQVQGEVLEIELESILRNAFPMDQLHPVPKGLSGADVIHKVLSRSGVLCGTIVWEAKRTKAWSDSWLQKAKDDQRAEKAELAVIVTEALPRKCDYFTRIKGVWVTSPKCALSLAVGLRYQLAEVALARMAATGKAERLEALYEYVTGAEFRHRVEVIVEAFTDLQADQHDERRAAERRWARREKQLQRVIASTAGMYGDLQGLIGPSMDTMPLLNGVPDQTIVAPIRALESA